MSIYQVDDEELNSEEIISIDLEHQATNTDAQVIDDGKSLQKNQVEETQEDIELAGKKTKLFSQNKVIKFK